MASKGLSDTEASIAYNKAVVKAYSGNKLVEPITQEILKKIIRMRDSSNPKKETTLCNDAATKAKIASNVLNTSQLTGTEDNNSQNEPTKFPCGYKAVDEDTLNLFTGTKTIPFGDLATLQWESQQATWGLTVNNAGVLTYIQVLQKGDSHWTALDHYSVANPDTNETFKFPSDGCQTVSFGSDQFTCTAGTIDTTPHCLPLVISNKANSNNYEDVPCDILMSDKMQLYFHYNDDGSVTIANTCPTTGVS